MRKVPVHMQDEVNTQLDMMLENQRAHRPVESSWLKKRMEPNGFA